MITSVVNCVKLTLKAITILFVNGFFKGHSKLMFKVLQVLLLNSFDLELTGAGPAVWLTVYGLGVQSLRLRF